MKRPLLCFCLFFIVTQCFLFLAPHKVILLLAVLFLIAAFLYKKKIVSKIAALLLVAVCLAAGSHFFIKQFYFGVFSKAYGTNVTLEGYYQTIEGQNQNGSVRATLQITHLEGKKLLIPVKVTAFSVTEHPKGSAFEGQFLINRPQSNQFSRYNLSQGIVTSVVPEKEILIKDTVHTPALFFKNLREHTSETLIHTLGIEQGSIASAMTVGEKSTIAQSLKTDFQKSGISHLLVVSGLHLSLLVGLFLSILKKMKCTLKGRNVICIVFVLCFMAFIGFTSSITRAGIMLIIVLLAPLFGKEADSPTSLGFAAFIIVCIKPYAVLDMAFWLSVASVAGVLFYLQWNHSLLENQSTPQTKLLQLANSSKKTIFRNFFAGFMLPIFVTIITLPVMAVFGGGFSLFSPVANLLAVPLAAPIMAFTYLILFVNCFPILNLLVKPLSFITKVLIYLLKSIAMFFSNIPFGHQYVKGVLPFLSVCSVAIILFIGYQKTSNAKVKFYKPIIFASLFLFFTMAFYQQYTFNTARIFTVGSAQSIVIVKQNHAVVIFKGGASQIDDITYFLAQNNLSESTMVVNLSTPALDVTLQDRLTALELLSSDHLTFTPFTAEPLNDILLTVQEQKKGIVLLAEVNGYRFITYTGSVSLSGYGQADVIFAENKLPFSAQTNYIVTTQQLSDQPTWAAQSIQAQNNLRIWVRQNGSLKIHKEYLWQY